MLESIRSGAQSLGVKIAFGLIILVFVFWGIGNYNDRDYTNVVAVVNGEPIVALEFEKAYHNAEEYLLRNNPGLTREQLIKDHLGRQVLNELIQATLVSQEARRAGIEVTPRELRAAVGQLKQFQDENGKFDPEAYRRLLENQRLAPAQYEKELSDSLLRDKMIALATAPAWINPDESLNYFNFLRERREIEYAFFGADSFKDKTKIDPAEIREWYDSHQSEFAIPPMVDVAYIAVAPEDLAKREDIAEKDALAWYEANLAQFARPERIRARHILVPLASDASEAAIKDATAKIEKAREELASGKSFASVADKYNEPGAADKGGDLGWLKRGQTVPEFERAAFALPVGKVSEPIKTLYGLHLVLVEEKQEAGTAPFEEAREDAYKALAFEAGSEKLHDALDNLIEDNILQKPLAEAASRYGLKTSQSGLLDKAGLMEKLGLKPEEAEALLATPADSPIDTALEAGNSYLIARISEAKPAGVKPFESVETEIRDRLAASHALELAMATAADELKRLDGKAPGKAPAFKTSAPLERGGIVPGFRPDPALQKAIFATPLHAWLPAPQAVQTDNGQSGALIAYVEKLVPPAPGEYESMADLLSKAAGQERAEGLYRMFLQNLASKAEIRITNENFIDRVNM